MAGRGGRRAVTTVVMAAVSLGALAGCATTYDATLATTTTVTPTTTTLPSGPTDQLLRELSDTAYGLSHLIVDGGDSRESYQRMADLWDAAKPDVMLLKPYLVEAFDQALVMCDNAVRFKRGADADKAALAIETLVTSFLA